MTASTSMSATNASTSTDPTTTETTGSTDEPSSSGGSSESGPGTTTTGPVECMPIPEPDDMPPECPSDQSLADPPITCIVADTLAPGNDVSTCAASPIPGSAYGFTADTAGVWVFSVLALATDPDPLIVVFDDQNNELACSTDIGPDPTPVDQAATVAVDLAAGQTIRITVQPEAPPAAAGVVVLRVAHQLDCSGDCCEADDARTSCEFEHYSDCVCMVDPTCCSTAWTDECVSIASGLCLAGCGPSQ